MQDEVFLTGQRSERALPGLSRELRKLKVSIPVVLCIDDEELGLEIRKMVLEREGYAVLTARDGPTGLSIFESQHVDAVVLDYAMPGLDGGQVAVMLRQRKPEVPLLLLSAYDALPEEVTRAVDAAATKGDGTFSLVERLKVLLEERKAR